MILLEANRINGKLKIKIELVCYCINVFYALSQWSSFSLLIRLLIV